MNNKITCKHAWGCGHRKQFQETSILRHNENNSFARSRGQQ